MITHKEALESANKIAEYCTERFRGSEENCTDCIFWRKNTKRCILKYYINYGGEEMMSFAYPIVQERFRELTKNE